MDHLKSNLGILLNHKEGGVEEGETEESHNFMNCVCECECVFVCVCVLLSKIVSFYGSIKGRFEY